MELKVRTKSNELLALEILDRRMDLSNEEKQYYLKLKKGYEGEVMFDRLTEKLQCDCIILNDLLLKLNHTTFQIDSLLITSDTLYLFEVKNFEGDFIYDSGKIYTLAKTEIMNPINQLRRNESLLRQLLLNIGFPFTIQASVVFINPGFTLYQSPINNPYIFPTQIHRYLQKLNANRAILSSKHKMLADKLVSLHETDSQYTNVPTYEYDSLKKGITCIYCQSFSLLIDGSNCICIDCGKEEPLEEAVIRNTYEFQILFPQHKITTRIVYEWCKIVPYPRRIRRILEKHYRKISKNRWTYFE